MAGGGRRLGPVTGVKGCESGNTDVAVCIHVPRHVQTCILSLSVKFWYQHTGRPPQPPPHLIFFFEFKKKLCLYLPATPVRMSENFIQETSGQ